MDLELVSRIGTKAAYEGGKILSSLFGNIKHINKKGRTDLVTEADTNSEKCIVEIIKNTFPDHGIMAEEGGVNLGENDAKWIIDPLDGTTNFVHELGLFSVSIAFSLKDDIVFGIVFNPITGELFSATKDKGATLNGKPICVSKSTSVSESLLVTGFPYQIERIHDIITRVWKGAGGSGDWVLLHWISVLLPVADWMGIGSRI